ncbi:MAG: flagellar biosynthetic protein FliR [Candidatus Zixiibacteriota bacterium]
MSNLDFNTFDWIWSYLWALFRVGGFFVTAPFWGDRTIPTRVRIPAALALTLTIGPIISASVPAAPPSVLTITAWAAHELIIGGLIGFCFAVLFWAVRAAGDIIGLQMGFAIAVAIDPNSPDQVSLIGEFKYILALLLLLMMDGHHLMITALVDTYRVIPVGGGAFHGPVAELVIRLSATFLVTAVKLGAPVVVTLLLTDVALGIVSRTVPQMNIFVVGFPLKIGVGLLVLGAALPLVAQTFTQSFSQIQSDTQRIIAALARP